MTFGETSTTDEVLAGIDLSGRRALVTGASAGLGKETARALAAHGAAVTMAVRDLPKAEAAAEEIRASVPGADIDMVRVDLANLASVRSGAADARDKHDTYDLLIANAGIMACPEWKTDDGFEMQMGANHLGHFVLVNTLAPAVPSGGRIVNLTSSGHRISGVDLDDPWFEKTPYNAWQAYGRSKSANVLFTVELDRRHQGRGVRSFAVHPGLIHTELSRHLTEETLTELLNLRGGGDGGERRPMPAAKSTEAGAATTCWAATSPDLDGQGGLYLEDCHVAEPSTDDAHPTGVRAHAIDPAIARELWAWSEQQVGETFPPV